MEQTAQKHYQSTGAIPKATRANKDFYEVKSEHENKNAKSKKAALSESETVKCKYMNIVDETDLKWYAEVTGQRKKDEPEDTLDTGDSISRVVANLEDSKPQKYISSKPILCPISHCKVEFLPNDMTMHFISFHHGPNVPIQKLHEKQRLLMTIAPFDLPPGELTCLGLVSYAGNPKKRFQRFAEENFCFEQNLLLNEEFKQMKDDYPIYILASVVSMGVFSKTENNNGTHSKLLIICLAVVNTDFPLTATITAHDEYKVYSRSSIAGLHSFFDCRPPQKLCKLDNKYFRLHFDELSTFVDLNNMLKLEFVFEENVV